MAPFETLSGNVVAPSGLQVVNEVLTNVAKQYRPQGYIYDMLVAPQLVNFNSGLYPVFSTADYFAGNTNFAVADRAPTPYVDFRWSTNPYQCIDYRAQTLITQKELNQAHPALRLDYSKTIGLLTQFATAREIRLAAALRATANGGQFTSNSGNAVTVSGALWDQGTTGTPANIQADLQSAALKVYQAAGILPNTVVMDFQVAYAIAQDVTIRDYIKYTVGADLLHQGSNAILPQSLFGFNVVIAKGSLANRNRPSSNTSPSLSSVWGNSVRLMYVDPNAQWGIPSTVYAFRGKVGGTEAAPPATVMPTSQGGQEPGPAGSWAQVTQWWDMDPPALHIRAWECVDERVVAPELGIEISPVLNTAF
jgi:hypothetical protein